MIRLVVGPPGSGKSTYIREREKPGDLVVELERFREFAGDDGKARILRGAVEAKAREFDGDVWIARTLASPADIESFRDRVGVDEVITLDTDADTCKSRVSARDGNENLFPAIDKWFLEHGPHIVDSDMEVEGMEKENVKAEQGSTDEVEAPEQESVEEYQERRVNEHGFPDETPVKEMTDKQQIAYWKFHARKHENAAKRQPVADPAPAPAPVPDPMLSRLFDAEFRAATAGIERDLTALKDSLEVSKFLDGDGGIDKAKLAEVISAVKPEKPNAAPAGAASRTPYEGATGYEYGLAIYDELKKKNGGFHA